MFLVVEDVEFVFLGDECPPIQHLNVDYFGHFLVEVDHHFIGVDGLEFQLCFVDEVLEIYYGESAIRINNA